MAITLGNYEIPVAYSMVKAAREVKSEHDPYHPFQKYFYYWTAFNNIYTTIAFYRDRMPKLKKQNGTIQTKANGHVQIPLVRPVSEKEQMALAFAEFDKDLRHRLIVHPGTEFFVNRVPSWRSTRIKTDAWGQRVNGVINVGYTVNADHPVWSPIDTEFYAHYLANNEDSTARDFLAEQIMDLLYTVRNNLMHGGKRFDDANDVTVLENALPLLEMVVSAFTKSSRNR